MTEIKLRNDFSYVSDEQQLDIYSNKFVEMDLKKNNLRFKSVPSFTKEFKGSKKDFISKFIDVNLQQISNSLVKKYGTVNVPAYELSEKEIFIEVITSEVIGDEKRDAFAKLIKNGFRILIARPNIEFEKNMVILHSIKWEEYKSFAKNEKIDISEV